MTKSLFSLVSVKITSGPPTVWPAVLMRLRRWRAGGPRAGRQGDQLLDMADALIIAALELFKRPAGLPIGCKQLLGAPEGVPLRLKAGSRRGMLRS